MKRTILRTARMELHPTAPGFADGLWAAIQSSLRELAPWMAWAVDPSEEDTRSFAERSVDNWDSGAAYNFTIVVDGVAAGQCGLDRVDSLANQCEIGYWMRSDLAGRGLMTEGAAAVVSLAFDEAGLHRIELHAGLKNLASNRIAEKLGFQREGILRDRGLGAGGYYDMYVYGLLESDRRA
jgi:RimJ/RimL family protein N-acetyltransferase